MSSGDFSVVVSTLNTPLIVRSLALGVVGLGFQAPSSCKLKRRLAVIGGVGGAASTGSGFFSGFLKIFNMLLRLLRSGGVTVGKSILGINTGAVVEPVLVLVDEVSVTECRLLLKGGESEVVGLGEVGAECDSSSEMVAKPLPKWVKLSVGRTGKMARSRLRRLVRAEGLVGEAVG